MRGDPEDPATTYADLYVGGEMPGEVRRRHPHPKSDDRHHVFWAILVWGSGPAVVATIGIAVAVWFS